MARKKSTQRKVKVGDPKNNCDEESSENKDTASGEQERADLEDQEVGDEESSSKTTLGNQAGPSPSVHRSQEKTPVAFIPVKVKEEPITEFDSHGCSKTTDVRHGYTSRNNFTNNSKLLKVKQEQTSKEKCSHSAPRLQLSRTAPSMDLGSHLEQSLSAPPSSALTWTHLMEPKNFPRAYEGTGQTNLAVTKESSNRVQTLGRISTHPAASDSKSYGLHVENIGKHSPSEDSLTVSTASKNATSPSATALSNSSNRFSSSSGNSGKLYLTEGGVSGGILDLSKKSLPPEIRRVLTSKYGLPKRNEDGHPAGVVPNFTKSRSRFTVAPKRAAGTESGPSEKMETNDSPSPSLSEPERDANKSKTTSHAPPQSSAGSSQTTTTCGSSEQAGQNNLVHENRESGRSPSASQAASDNHPPKDISDNLKNHGLLDLASHYGNLLTAPVVRARSASRSPRIDEAAASPGPQNPVEAMIDLGSVGRLNELRGTALRRGGEPMIDLSAMEAPKSPLSPSFRSLAFPPFPNPNYRSNNYPNQNYRPRVPANRKVRSNPSPTVGPRLQFGPQGNRPSSPEHRPPIGSMIDLGSFGNVSRPYQMLSRTDKRFPKRRHSLDSNNLREAAKRPCTERENDSSGVKKTDVGVTLNIGDLLNLEREEQKYIKELSVVQAEVTDVRFKIQKMQQDLETLRSSEAEIKRRIDMVRAKRVRILKDAQDREGSGGTPGNRVPEIPDKREERFHRAVEGGEGGKLGERTVTYDRTSPAYLTSYRDEQSDGRESTESKRKVEVVTGVEEDDKNLIRGSETPPTRIVEIDRFGGYHYGSHSSRNRNNLPSRSVQHSSHGSSSHNVSEPRHVSYGQHYPSTSCNSAKQDRSKDSLGKFGELDDDRSRGQLQHRRFGDSDKYISGEIDVAENGDGTLLVRQHGRAMNSYASKGSDIERSDADYKVKVSDSDGPRQFLGCLEISSTTDELPFEDDQGPKEILAEKERESFAKKLRCDQGRISSTVPSLDDKAEVDSLSEIEFTGHTDAVCYILPYKGKLFSASADRTVKAFDLKTGECTNTFQGHQKGINCLQIASEVGGRDRLFTGSNDQTVRAYNAKSGTCTHKFSFRGRVMCLHVAFGKLFVGLSSGFVAVIDLMSNKCIDQFCCHESSRISCLASRSEGQPLLCTGSFDSTITLRDQSSGKLLRTIKDHKLTVLCIQVVGNILFSGSADTVVQSHNIDTGQLVRSYTGHSMSVSGLQALGGVLVTSSLDRIIRCFDIETGDLLQLYGGNNDMIFSLAVFRDMIYTGCRDGKLSGIKLDLRKYHCCKWGSCSLKFGLLNDLKQHVRDHVNQTYVFDSCLWEGCVHKFPRGKQLDVIQAAMEHIFSHVPDTET